MTRLVADAAAAALRCPYCQFPLKPGSTVERCDACGAMHHEECWTDGRGCAVFGCANAGSTAVATEPTQRLTAPPPPPPRADSTPTRGGGRALAIGVGVGALVAAIGIGAFVLGTQAGDNEVSPTSPASSAPTLTTSPAVETEPPPPPPGPTEAEVARELEAIVDFSVVGRDAVRNGRYAEATANRRAVLRRLRALRGATGRAAAARAVLVRAMEASLQSDLHYAAGTDASATDAEATRLKRLFVERFAPIAREHGLFVYGAGDF